MTTVVFSLLNRLYSVGDEAVHPLTIRFGNAELESEFQAVHSKKALTVLRVSKSLSITLFCLFGFWDRIAMPESFYSISLVRFGLIIPFLLAMFFVTYAANYGRYMQWSLVAGFWAAGAGLIAMMVIEPRVALLYGYPSLMLVFLFTPFERLQAVYSAVICVPLTLLYLFVSALWLNQPPTLIITQGAFVVTACLIGIIICYVLERYARTEFVQSQLLERRSRELHEANMALREASDLKTQLLGIAAHDLKNPLSAIINFAERALTHLEESPIKTRQSVLLVQDLSHRMLHVIDQLLNTTSIESGRVELQKRVIDIGQLAKVIVAGYESHAEQKHQKLEVTAEPNSIVEGDEDRLQEVIENLLSNALKYSPPEKTVHIDVTSVGGCVRLEVRDEGLGLTPDDMTKLFGRFQRLSARPTGGESSSGLGLAIVKQLVELHSGKVWAESAGEGKGATFIIELPKYISN
ncbi:MAG: HAMP domain-containing histidine kinase [Rhizobacter sp.]|nr:HAMP domain-containing histidine kinase [Chlorobiales bacterium]